MERAVWKSIGLLSVAILFAVLPRPVLGATYLYNWNTGPVTSITDPVGDSTAPYKSGQDITKAWQAYDGIYQYFRIDLAHAPTPYNHAATYGFYIDFKAGGAPSSNAYIPGDLVGIDFIISSDYEICEWDADAMVWKTKRFSELNDPKFQAVMNGGTTLEWRIRDNYQGNKTIGETFRWWAATMYESNNPSHKKTYDIAGPVVTPIPNAAWLLGVGVIALVGLKRRRPKP